MAVLHSCCCCRETWANYFDKEGVCYAFWSAHLEAAKFDAQPSAEEGYCSDDDGDEQEIEDDEDLDLLPQAMARSFVLEDECATMTTDHELTSEVLQQTNDNHSETNCDIGPVDTPNNQTTDNITLAPSQTAVVDGVTDLPSQHETTELTHVTNESDQTTSLHVDDTEVEPNVGSNTLQSDATVDKMVDINPRAKLLTGSELLDLFRSLCSKMVQKKDGEPVVIGMVGYPNVGKSSTINTLIHGKKVPVSATPGRTKHFQVHYICIL